MKGDGLHIDEHFASSLDPRWSVIEVGKAQVVHSDRSLSLTDLPTSSGYSNAQIDDYTPNKTRNKLSFQWRPPLKMTVKARASATLRGTAGFGFWNHPFAPGKRGFRLPQSVWFFFGSPPSNMALAKGVPGYGWKAASFDARRWQFLTLLPAAPFGVLLMRVPMFYNALWSIGQRAIGVSEKLLDTSLLSEWHTYTLEWRTEGATFAIDNVVVHQAPYAPRAALGFVAWLDNQYAVVTPQGQLGFGVLPIENPQSLMLEHIRIETL